MAYRITRSDGSVEAALRRIATEQIDKALAEFDDPELGRDETVHQVRKRCKKLRGLVRLVRPGFDGYGAANDTFRDAARDLSFLRDAQALIACYDKLADAYAGQIDRRALGSVRRRLTLRRKAAAARPDIADKLDRFRATMVAARRDVADWQLESSGFAAVGGFRKTYARARDAMDAARKSPSPETFQEWRKRVKYHWYHARLLRPIWPIPMKAHRDAASDLGDLLGDYHDLAVLRSTVAAAPGDFGNPADIEVLFGLIDQRQAVLAAEAFAIGDRLLAEPPKALARRWKAYWRAWQSDKPARAAALAA
jgi:CHAD domain-containing protein